MAIEDLGISLLDRQERLTEEERRRREERRQKDRRAKRREALTGLAIQGGVKIGNAVLAERSDNFFDKEWDMASRAKYKAAVSARDDTQALWTNIRQTHDSSADWKLAQLRGIAKQHLKDTVPDWDGKINKELAAELKEKATAWGGDFDQKYNKSFEIEDYDKYAAGLQKKFGRPKDIGSWVTRGIVDRIGGHSGDEARQSRLSKLRSEIDGFDDKYGDMFRVANAEGTISQAIEAAERIKGDKRTGVLGITESGGAFWRTSRILNEDGKTYTMKVERITNIVKVHSDSSGSFVVTITPDGKHTTERFSTKPKTPLNATQLKEQTAQKVLAIFENKGGGATRENYEYLKENHSPLYMNAVNRNVEVIKSFWDEDIRKELTTVKIAGGQTAINDAIESLASDLKNRVTMDENGTFMKAFEAKGFNDEQIKNTMEKLQDFFDDGTGSDNQSFKNLTLQEISNSLARQPNATDLNPVKVVQEAVVITAAKLGRVPETSFFGKLLGKDRVILEMGGALTNEERIAQRDEWQQQSAINKVLGNTVAEASFSKIVPVEAVKQLKKDLSNMETPEEKQQLLDGVSAKIKSDHGTTVTFSPEILNLVKGIDEGIDDKVDTEEVVVGTEDETDTRTEAEIELDQLDENTKNILGFLRDRSVGEIDPLTITLYDKETNTFSDRPEEDVLKGFESKRARRLLQNNLTSYLNDNRNKFQPVESPNVVINALRVKGAEISGETERDVAAMKKEMASGVDREMIDKAKDIFGNDYTKRDSYIGYFMRNPQDLQLLIDSDWDMNKFIMAK